MAIRRAACGHSPEPVSPLWRLPDQFASTPRMQSRQSKIFDSQECDTELYYSAAERVAQDENVFCCAAEQRRMTCVCDQSWPMHTWL
ncbi:MAG: hypothetical protein WC689_13370, partial [Methylocystis sp.]